MRDFIPKPHGAWLLAILLGTAGTALAQPAPAELLKQLASPAAEVRQQAWERAAEYGPGAIVTIAPLLDNPAHEVRRAARLALERIAGAASASPESSAAAARALAMAAISVGNRDWLLWLLSYTGTAASTQALTALLQSNPEQYPWILFALEAIAQYRDETGQIAVLEAPELPHLLIGLLDDAPEPKQVAIINTLGTLRAAAAVPALRELVRGQGATAQAACAALGHIGTPAVAPVLLDVYARDRSPEVLEAILRAAERQPPPAAKQTYTRLLRLLPSPDTFQHDPATESAAAHAAVVLGLGAHASSARDIRWLLRYLDAPRADLRGAARDALIQAPGERVTATLIRALRGASDEQRARLIDVIRARDPEAAAPLLPAFEAVPETPEVE